MQADGTYRVYIKNGSFSKNLMEDNDWLGNMVDGVSVKEATQD